MEGKWILLFVRDTNIFARANIEYVEFWLMYPFITSENGKIDDGSGEPKNNTTGGKLVFHLGSLSEDLMRDVRWLIPA